MEGCNIDNILTNFQKTFPKNMEIKLEKNYRSTQRILDGAWSVVSNNKNRAEKKLEATRGKGEKYLSLPQGVMKKSPMQFAILLSQKLSLIRAPLKILLFFIELMPSQDLLNKLWLKKVYLTI